jgi:hypothetical protein
MADTVLDVDFGALRRKVRAAQHTRSVPLIIIGALLVNYGAGWFAPSPVAWRFGAPLAFVAVAVALWLIEMRTGVGTTRGADFLIAGGFVFMVTNIVQVRPFTHSIDSNRLPGVWVIIVALALLGVALTVSDWPLMLASAAIGAAGAFLLIAGSNPTPSIFFLDIPPEQPWGFVLVAVVGALLVLAGIVTYRFERSAS